MASFTIPFDPVTVTRHADVTINLPDPSRGTDEPLVRPGVARFANATLTLLHVTPAGASFDLFAPVKGAARNVILDAPLPGGINQLLEISPFPFAIAPALRVLKAGLPTFYLGYNRAANFPADDDLVNTTAALASVTGDAYVGLLFQDRVALAPWAWIEMIRAAMQSSGDSVGATNWNTLASLYAGTRSLRVLDHAGRPAGATTFDIRIYSVSGIPEGPWQRTVGADADLEQAVITNPLPRSAGPQASLFGAAGEMTELKWKSDGAGNADLPVQALYETGLSSPPGEAILLPALTERGHLQILELGRWFSPRPAGTSPQLARYRTNSRVEPLVDGIPTFKRLVDDLLASASAGNGAHFAGWAFKSFPLDEGRTDAAGAAIDTELPALLQHIIDNGGDARFLAFKFVNFKNDPDTDAKRVAAIILLLASSGLLFYTTIKGKGTDSAGYYIIFGGFVLSALLINNSVPDFLTVPALLESKQEQSQEIFSVLNGIRDHCALWAIHPVRLNDNPVPHPPMPLGLDNYIDQVGSFHQKIQLIKRPADPDRNEYIAYVGGIDINADRLDTPGHQIVSPFHDVHARVTGPGAADIFTTWDERYSFHRSTDPASLDPVFLPPDADSLPAQTAKHITQVGRTYYRRNPVGGSSGLPFAPDGETTINDTLIRAIKSAREYIYIEDQYFTPNDSEPEGSAETYFDVLLNAASTCRRLVILVPAETDQPFGDLRRRYLFSRLRAAWADRILIGCPLRRPVLPNTGRGTNEGRCRLMTDMTASDSKVFVWPEKRVPRSGPFWLFVDGELMLSSELPKFKFIAGRPGIEISVLRGPSGSDPRWQARARKHKEGAPVTFAQLKGIYVHAKIMMIDDVFVSIGSANINRRGLFHDAEISVFTVPEQIKAAPDNPALALRTALWAEHLGLPPRMGAALLSDPIAAFEFFRRSRYEGNRFTPFNALDLKPYISLPLGDGILDKVLRVALTPIGLGAVDDLIPWLWNILSDPSSYTDPDPISGPTP